MGVAERVRTIGEYDVDAFMAFVEGRPDEEKWQLIDGLATLMSPASFIHQRIVWNLQFALNAALALARPDLFAYGKAGVRLPTRRDFQPEPDVVVAASTPPEGSWTDDYALVAEVLSPSNSHESIDRKVELYASNPANLHVLVVAQDAVKVVHRARTLAWRPLEFGDEDVIKIPEFNFEIPVLELYRGTPLCPT